ncbi:MAG: Ig protein [Acidobacteriales bacterium]|nr:Ig protein [Terriglobales bacterium]
MLLASSCGGSASSATSVSSIVVIPSVSSTTVNGHQTFTANALNSDSNSVGTVTFTWASSDANVAVIDSTGVATGKSGGTTQITATSNNVTSPPVNLTVFPDVASVSITPINATIKVGQQQHFVATATDVKGNIIANAVLNWSVSFSGVATIDSSGTATAVSVGTVLVTASVGGVSSPIATLNVTP